MKIKILSSALEDLYVGRLFYEKQGEGLGEYFFDSLFSDIDSLVLYGGIHTKGKIGDRPRFWKEKNVVCPLFPQSFKPPFLKKSESNSHFL